LWEILRAKSDTGGERVEEKAQKFFLNKKTILQFPAAALPLLAGDHHTGNWVHKNPAGILIRTQEQEEREGRV